MRRRAVHYGSLTSLLDVLFLLVFAALVQGAALVEEAEGRAPEPVAEAEPAPQVEPAAADAGPPPGRRAVYDRAIGRLEARLRRAPALLAHIEGGALAAVEIFTDDEVTRVRVGLPLVARSADPDVALAYVGDRAPARRLCALVAAAAPGVSLADAVIVVVPDAELAALPVALVEGLRADERRCAADLGAWVVTVPAPELAEEIGR